MRKLITISVIVLIAIITISVSLFTVKENQFVSVKRFSKIVRIETEPGIKFKVPFLDSAQDYPRMKMLYDLKSSDLLTSDKKAMIADTFVIWEITDLLRFVQTVSYVEEVEKRIDAAVYNAIKNTMGTLEQSSIISEKGGARGEFNTVVTSLANDQLKDYGIKIMDVQVKRLDIPPDNEQAVYRRMISEREQIAEDFLGNGRYEAEKIKNDTNKEIEILTSRANARAAELIGEGEREYMKILAQAYSGSQKAEFYEFIRTLDALKKSLKGQKTLILPIDSPLTRVLIGK